MPARTSTAGPARNATLTLAARCASAAAGCPATSGRSSSPITTPGSPTGTPTRPTRPASAPTSGPTPPTRAPARLDRAVDPANRLVARGLEREWETALRELTDAEAELARRQTARPKTLTPQEKQAILALGDDLGAVWDAPTTTDKDRKQLLRTLLDEVNITLHRDDPDPHAALVLRWKGGAISELTVPLRRRQPKIRTSEDTISLIRRLAVHYPDAQIAGILNRQHRTTARGLSFTASRVASLRTHWHIPCHQPSSQPA